MARKISGIQQDPSRGIEFADKYVLAAANRRGLKRGIVGPVRRGEIAGTGRTRNDHIKTGIRGDPSGIIGAVSAQIRGEQECPGGIEFGDENIGSRSRREVGLEFSGGLGEVG